MGACQCLSDAPGGKLTDKISYVDHVSPVSVNEAAVSEGIASSGDDGRRASASGLNILLQEDLTIRGGAQLWLVNCGARLQAAGHNVTFLLPVTSLIVEDCEQIAGATVAKYDPAEIASAPSNYKAYFTAQLRGKQVCVALVRQMRGKFQNVSFIAECIKDATLSTFLIAKTGTPDPSYETAFYGGPLLETGQCCVVTIAQYTKDYLVKNMSVPAELITNVYNGTDTSKFKRTPEMAAEALKRYPCATPADAFVVGCVGSYEERKAQSLLLKAAKKLIDDGKLPRIHCLFVGEGPDKEMLQSLIVELGISEHVSLCDFTKEPFFVFERCELIALPSTGKEGLPNVLLEALAMEKPCVATDAYGIPEVVINGKTGYVFPSGDVDALAEAIAKIGGASPEERRAMAVAGREMVFAEHDKAQQFEKILEIIVQKATNAFEQSQVGAKEAVPSVDARLEALGIADIAVEPPPRDSEIRLEETLIELGIASIVVKDLLPTSRNSQEANPE